MDCPWAIKWTSGYTKTSNKEIHATIQTFAKEYDGLQTPASFMFLLLCFHATCFLHYVAHPLSLVESCSLRCPQIQTQKQRRALSALLQTGSLSMHILQFHQNKHPTKPVKSRAWWSFQTSTTPLGTHCLLQDILLLCLSLPCLSLSLLVILYVLANITSFTLKRWLL